MLLILRSWSYNLTTLFLSLDAENIKDEQKTKSEGGKCDIQEYHHKRRNMILAAIFAGTVMLGYAVANGLLQVTLSDAEPSLNTRPVLPPTVSNLR